MHILRRVAKKLALVMISYGVCNAICFPTTDIILRKSSIDSFSFVEYCHNQEWVTLCDRENEWTDEDALVICKQADQYTGNDTMSSTMCDV